MEHWLFYPDDKLEMYIMRDQIQNKQTEEDYDLKGTKKEWPKVCVDCKYYFDDAMPPEASPDPIYVR